MKNSFLVLISFLFLTSFSNDLVMLNIKINGLKNSTGYILLELQDENQKVVTGVTEKIENKKCLIRINNLKPGKYSFKFFHDENKNKKIDTQWPGIPTEGFGFSNNIKAILGEPSTKRTMFSLTESRTVECSPQYFMK